MEVARRRERATALMRGRFGACWLTLLLLCPHQVLGQLAAKSADEWLKILESPARLRRVNAPDVVAALKLLPGTTIADIGAGTGVFTFPMALAVKPDGIVYAVDLTKDAVDYIEERATEQGLVNVRAAVGSASDPGLPANVDLIFLHDTLRYVARKQDYLKMLGDYLSPGGRIVVIEYKPDQYPDRSDPDLVVSENETSAWMKAIGFTPVESVTAFRDRWFVFYGR